MDLTHPRTLARAHGAFNIVGGVWPLVHLRSFEAVFGPKYDRWLEHTVAGLMLGNGLTQVATTDTRSAKWVGLTVAGTFLAIDLVYVPKGRIRWTYLIDAAMEVGWIGLWIKAREA